MPTILRVGPYRFYFYSYDSGEPRHTHGDRENCGAKVWLDSDASLVTNHGYGRRELRGIQRMPGNMERDLVSGGWHNVNGKRGANDCQRF